MMRNSAHLSVALWLVAMCGLVHAQQSASTAPPSDAEIAALIGNLGSDDYFTRRDAEQRLLQVGPHAFDALKAAEQHDDLEVSSRASYILQQVRVQWSRSGDTPAVRRRMVRYEELPEERREEVIRQLAGLPDGEGAAALCRIARFEASGSTARQAALAVMQMKPRFVSSAATEIENEIGSSRRVPVQWLRALLTEKSDPKSAQRMWRQACENEARLLEGDNDETDWLLIWQLWHHELTFCNREGFVEATAGSLAHLVDVCSDHQTDGIPDGLPFALKWCIETKRWQVFEIIEQRYEARIRDSRAMIYYLAIAYREQGDDGLARQTAEHAFSRFLADDDETRRELAAELAVMGELDWAEREWQYVIDNFPELDVNSVIARFELANWRFDRRQFRDAAELLAPTCDAVVNNKAERMRLEEKLEKTSDGPELKDFIGRRDYYLACHYESIGDYESETRHLELAAAEYERNIDVLIAMVHAKGADADYIADAQIRIKRAKRRQLNEIEEWTEHAGGVFAASRLNEWAWLTANTSDDSEELKKAIEFSHKSLELRPDEPAFLDTLGRCYFAAGEYSSAVKYQRRAVELEPNLQVMQRQLAEFERAMENQGGRNVQAND